MYECVSTVLSHNDQQYVYSCDELYMTLLSLYFVILCNLIIYALLDIKIQAYITMDSRHFIRQKKERKEYLVTLSQSTTLSIHENVEYIKTLHLLRLLIVVLHLSHLVMMPLY